MCYGCVTRHAATIKTGSLRARCETCLSLRYSMTLIIPATLISYTLAWVGGAVRGIAIVWVVALALLLLGLLFRDGYRGRSIGKPFRFQSV